MIMENVAQNKKVTLFFDYFPSNGWRPECFHPDIEYK